MYVAVAISLDTHTYVSVLIGAHLNCKVPPYVLLFIIYCNCNCPCLWAMKYELFGPVQCQFGLDAWPLLQLASRLAPLVSY